MRAEPMPSLRLPGLRLAVLSYGCRSDAEARRHRTVGARAGRRSCARGHDVVVFSHDPRPTEPPTMFARCRGDVRRHMARPPRHDGLSRQSPRARPEYREFDAVIAHGDSLLLPMTASPWCASCTAARSARRASDVDRPARPAGGCVRQELAELLTAGVVGVSENTRRDNPFVRHDSPRRRHRIFSEAGGVSGARSRRWCLSARSTGASAGGFLLDGFHADGARRARPSADARLRRSRGARSAGRDLSHGHH